ncbi:complement factor H-related protein 1-like [Candoia aspera]|uniref:complement factor H-related protein 1-like n=1 Tax=Candoia aspera TaxID=51853 RepID=UPI002FD7BE0E
MKSWLFWAAGFLLWIYCSSQRVCEEPPDINFAEIVSEKKATYLENDRVQYRCNPGYVLEGSEWILCNGQEWTPRLPKCLAPCSITKEQLATENLFLFGGRRRTQLIQSNRSLVFQCSEEYILTVPSVRKCVDGHMDLPLCISKSGRNCSGSPRIENGDIITLSEQQYRSGSSVEFRCQKYYAMEGQNRSFCDNGTWTKVPVCLDPCTIPRAKLERQKIEVKVGMDVSENIYVQHGRSMELTCRTGYVLAANSSQSDSIIHCDGTPPVIPRCKEITCNPPRISNGSFRPQRTIYHDGDLLRIQCDHGFNYEPDNGERVVECTRNGWSPSPKCVDVRCPPPPQLPNGQINGIIKERYLPMERVSYRCRSGYSLIGRAFITCLKQRWTEAPRCADIGGRCGRPPHVDDGDIVEIPNSYYNTNDRVTYQCQHRYKMIGSPRVTCQNGYWSQTPTCRVPCTASEEDMRQHKIKLRWKPDDKIHSEAGREVDFECERRSVSDG